MKGGWKIKFAVTMAKSGINVVSLIEREVSRGYIYLEVRKLVVAAMLGW